MAAYRILFDDVFNKLSEITIIKTVEEFNSQYDNTEINNLKNYPAAYVEASHVTWDQNMNKFYNNEIDPQTGTAEIKVHIVYHTLKSFDKNTKDIFFGIVDTVVSSLQRMQCQANEVGTYSTLLRTDESYKTNNKQLRVCILTFKTKLTDIFLEKDNIEELVTFTINTAQDYGDALRDVDNNFILDDDNNFIYDLDITTPISIVPNV